MNEAEKPHYHGHRQRLKQRFLESGAKSLADYEFLELILGLAIPRRDVKPLAKELLQRFGGIAEVLQASPADLMTIKGVGEGAAISLTLIKATADRLLQQKTRDLPVIRNWENVLAYCQSTMSGQKDEQLRLLFLDSKNQIIHDEVQQIGTVDQTPIYPRQVVKRALEIGASAVIMVHNHPSGDPTPSRADVELTTSIKNALRAVDIKLHDHLVIGKGNHSSLREMGLIIN